MCNVQNLITATSTTGQIFLLALVSEISVLSSIISTLFCLLELVDPLPKLDLLVSIGVTLMYRSLFLCLFFQIWRELVDPPWSFNWTNVSWISHPRWNNSKEGWNWGCWGDDEAAVELLWEDFRKGINPNLAWYFPSQRSVIDHNTINFSHR